MTHQPLMEILMGMCFCVFVNVMLSKLHIINERSDEKSEDGTNACPQSRQRLRNHG
jgi:hypothetical protein